MPLSARRGLLGLLAGLPLLKAAPAAARSASVGLAGAMPEPWMPMAELRARGIVGELASFEPDLEPMRRVISEQLRLFVGQTIAPPAGPTCPPWGWDTLENVR